jgi:prepilin-type N-terminal cleavage/methylation domain-containing protein
MRTERARRGMTLIELMMTVAMASVLATTVTAVVAAISRSKRDGERTLEVRTNAVSALSAMQFDAANAGYRFSSAPFAAYVMSNVVGNEAGLAGITTTANCGQSSWGVAPGSDVVEFREGISTGEPADVLSGSCVSGSCTGVQLSVGRVGIDPAVGDIVLLGDGISGCMGKVTLATSPSFNVQLLKQDLTNATGAEYPNCLASVSPTQRWRMMRLGRRVRYLVCAPPATDLTSKPALYRQESDSSGTFPGASPWGMTLVQEQVEDLQAAWRVSDPATEFTGGTCSGASGSRVCECNGWGGTCVGFVPYPTISGVLDVTAAAPLANRSAYLIRGLTVGITSINSRPRRADGTGGAMQMFVRPNLFDHAQGGVKSGDFRSTVTSSVSFQNVVMVTR